MKVELDGVRPWRHDLAGCLHACVGTLVDHAGFPPLEVLGSFWGFYYRPGDIRPEEYYFPCPDGRSLVASLAPHHPVGSRWWWPEDAEQGWQQVREQVAAGVPVAVAVDNFELPFRPAYRDVHSNHLVVVRGFDDERQTVSVLDAIPPFFSGELPLAVLTAARDSANRPAHARDMFFADDPIGNRWLQLLVEDGPGGRQPAGADPAGYLAGNLREFQAGSEPGCYRGRDGIARFLADMCDRLAAGYGITDELFVVAGVALAGAAVHADWVAETGRRQQLPGWPELARQISRTAYHWTAIRILAALSRTGDVPATRLRARRAALLAELDRTLAAVEVVLATTEPSGHPNHRRALAEENSHG
ncbi:BtrH N-terminal domain-containing protein [Jatrophihabitans sp.]|uniref:BtrH N-terminal domain-containing protein n=1 Tax=Jatrophihabitans sp. TaxID=1932789 RepID=UPI002CAD7CE7|nr:BtrH N-terminal domain-containing protein [Jatrophihabitans sp.]